jgi:hypothetical protein
MHGRLSTSLRIATAGAAAAIFGLQPVVSFAQSEPATTPASCTLPVLDLANPSPGAVLSAGAYVVQGLAVDPESQHGSGINEVSFFLGPRDQGGIQLGEAVPEAGPEQDGFSATLTLPGSSVGERTFVAYARSALSGKETEVSLPIVLGETPSKAELAPVDDTETSTNPGAMPTCEGSTLVSVQAGLPAVVPILSATDPTNPMGEQPPCEECNSGNGD